MKKHFAFKLLLLSQVILLMVFSVMAFQKEGADLFSVFFGNILTPGWNAQFNLDFTCYLMLSGLWIMWRNKFSAGSIVLGTAAAIVGIMIFASYMLYLLFKEDGDMKKVLLGDR